MKLPSLELQNVIVGRLNDLGYRVFDGLPMTEEDYPFIALDNDFVLDEETLKTDNITDIYMVFYIWSDYLNGGSMEAKQIADTIVQDFVHFEENFFMSNFTCLMCEFESMRVNRQTENLKQLTQLILTLKFKILENKGDLQ